MKTVVNQILSSASEAYGRHQLFQVQGLFPDFLDVRFGREGQVRSSSSPASPMPRRFRQHSVRFAVHFLQQEIQALADLAAASSIFEQLSGMNLQSCQFLFDVRSVGQDGGLLGQSPRINSGILLAVRPVVPRGGSETAATRLSGWLSSAGSGCRSTLLPGAATQRSARLRAHETHSVRSRQSSRVATTSGSKLTFAISSSASADSIPGIRSAAFRSKSEWMPNASRQRDTRTHNGRAGPDCTGACAASGRESDTLTSTCPRDIACFRPGANRVFKRRELAALMEVRVESSMVDASQAQGQLAETRLPPHSRVAGHAAQRLRSGRFVSSLRRPIQTRPPATGSVHTPPRTHALAPASAC